MSKLSQNIETMTCDNDHDRFNGSESSHGS